MKQNIIVLIDKVIKKTSKKQAVWSKTSSPNEFSLKLPGGRITTDSWTGEDDYNDRPGQEMVDITIYNESGDVAFSRTYTKQEDPDAFAIVAELHQEANASYYQLDKTVDSMLAEMGDDKILGEDDEDEYDSAGSI